MKKRMLISFLPFALGAFTSLSMAPANFIPALFVGLSSLYIYVKKCKTAKESALIGFLFSLGYFGFSLSWVGNALLVENNPYWWAWPLAVSGLPLILAPFTAIMCYIYKTLYKNDEYSLASFITFCACIFAAEYGRGHLFSGFPWNLYGYTWVDIAPIAQIVALDDIYLLTFLTIFWCVAPAFIMCAPYSRKKSITYSSFIFLTFALCWIWGHSHLSQSPSNSTDSNDIEFVLVQPNIKQSEKWKQENLAKNFEGLIEQSSFHKENHSPDTKTTFIIWPETAISQSHLNAPWATQMITTMLKDYPNEAYLITGALRYEQLSESYYNSLIIIDNTGRIIHTYNKSHLVPFGEYMPLEDIINIAPIVGFTGFQKGKEQTKMTMPNGTSISPLICYEIIFPDKARKTTELKSNFIVNVTNDAWYGDSAGPYQHLAQSRFRAIETKTPILRVANTGITAMIDTLGYIENSIPLMQKNTLTIKTRNSIIKKRMPVYLQNLWILFMLLLVSLLNYTKVTNLYRGL